MSKRERELAAHYEQKWSSTAIELNAVLYAVRQVFKLEESYAGFVTSAGFDAGISNLKNDLLAAAKTVTGREALKRLTEAKHG